LLSLFLILGGTPNLLAYYRANEGTGFSLAPQSYSADQQNPFQGALNRGTYWDVSGVQSLAQSVELPQSTVSLVELYGSDTSYRPITYYVGSLPARGKLFYAKNLNSAAAEITSVNVSLAGYTSRALDKKCKRRTDFDCFSVLQLVPVLPEHRYHW
jgi:hypothetical protein